MQNSEQRSQEWFDERAGKFTASRISELLGIKALGLTGEGYAMKMAIEEVYGREENDFMSYDMQRGVELEPLAFNHFKEKKALEFIDVQNCGFFKNCDHSGASPDGLVGEDAILEIKCPNRKTFFKLKLTNEIDSKYFAQMQMQMMSTNRNKAYFFNYLIIDGVEHTHEIEIERCETTIEKIKNRIEEAVKIKQQFINKLKA